MLEFLAYSSEHLDVILHVAALAWRQVNTALNAMQLLVT